jgi:hypothetical protein
MAAARAKTAKLPPPKKAFGRPQQGQFILPSACQFGALKKQKRTRRAKRGKNVLTFFALLCPSCFARTQPAPLSPSTRMNGHCGLNA